MARARNRDAVLKTLRKALDEDRTRTYVVEISPLGLVEMTRQNVTEGVREIMTKTCPTCDGEGVVRSEETIAIDVERRLRELASASDAAPEALLVQVNPRVAADSPPTARASRCASSRSETGKLLPLRGHGGRCRSTTSRSSLEGTREEIEERALPFSRARRSWSRSRSRTCTTSTTRSPRSTAT